MCGCVFVVGGIVMSEMSFFESLLVDYLIELCVCLVCVLFGLGVVLLGLMFFS